MIRILQLFYNSPAAIAPISLNTLALRNCLTPRLILGKRLEYLVLV